MATLKSHRSKGQIMLRLNCNKESDNGSKAVITETIVFARQPFALDSSIILDWCWPKWFESSTSSRIPNPDRGAAGGGGGGRVLWTASPMASQDNGLGLLLPLLPARGELQVFCLASSSPRRRRGPRPLCWMRSTLTERLLCSSD